jgi:CheY-like chemotaxis protein
LVFVQFSKSSLQFYKTSGRLCDKLVSVTKLPESDNNTLADDRLCVIGEADLFMARLLRRYASTCGLNTLYAQTGDDLLDWTHPASESQQLTPALIILDPELPGKVRGWEVAQALQAGCELSSPMSLIPVVLCSWLSEAEAQALAGRAAPCLQKPDVHYDDFVAALERVGVLPGGPHPPSSVGTKEL